MILCACVIIFNMPEPTIGIIIVAVSIFGYISNWLNWRFLNYKINHWLYYLGAFVHETSHAIVCLLIGAMIGPSWRDLKNVWILIIILIFIPLAFFAHLGFFAIALILMNILLQIILILVISVIKSLVN